MQFLSYLFYLGFFDLLGTMVLCYQIWNISIIYSNVFVSYEFFWVSIMVDEASIYFNTVWGQIYIPLWSIWMSPLQHDLALSTHTDKTQLKTWGRSSTDLCLDVCVVLPSLIICLVKTIHFSSQSSASSSQLRETLRLFLRSWATWCGLELCP